MDSSIFIGKVYYHIFQKITGEHFYFCNKYCAQTFQENHQNWKYCNHPHCFRRNLFFILYRSCIFYPYKIEPVFFCATDLSFGKHCDHCNNFPPIQYLNQQEFNDIFDEEL